MYKLEVQYLKCAGPSGRAV